MCRINVFSVVIAGAFFDIYIDHILIYTYVIPPFMICIFRIFHAITKFNLQILFIIEFGGY